VLGASATITIGFSTKTSSNKGLTADDFYDVATESLRNSVSDITSSFETTCGCKVSMDTVKVELSTLIAEEEAMPVPQRDLAMQAQKTTFTGSNIEYNTGNQKYAGVLPTPSTTYYAGSDCPNGCSGHGSCSTNGCVCWPNWGNGDESGGACDQRICPYEIAWVDTPTAANTAHALRECAGRGLCDRMTGDCACFPGYEGKGCRRSVCPNDCSGHGTCAYLSELRNDVGDAFKLTGDASTSDQYRFEFDRLWDAYKTRGCVCDPKYHGVDCSIRMCPKGDDRNYFALEKRPETQAIIFTNVFTPGNAAVFDDDDKPTYKSYNGVGDVINDNFGEFALTFRTTLDEEYTTATMNVYNLTEEILEMQLNSLPNKVIEELSVVLYRNLSKFNQTNDARYGTDGGVKVNTRVYPFTAGSNYSWYDTDLVALVTFNGAMTTGNQYALTCRTAYCNAGCQPKIEFPLDFKIGSSCNVVNDYVPSIATNWECSGRGLCDTSGVCECFEGYTDEFCSTKTAII
jgi:hypothetical protein